MRRAWVVLLVLLVWAPSSAEAGNSDEVNAGLDVTLTGGAVVANVHTGAALWYNPAGIARISRSSLELTGVTLQTQIAKVPGLLSIDGGIQSAGKTVGFSVVPQAITFTFVLRPNLKFGFGIFNSSVRRDFVNEQLTYTPTDGPVVEVVEAQDSQVDLLHLSSGLAGEFGAKQKVLFGGAFDFVIARSRIDGTFAVSYDDGESGFFTDGNVLNQTGFGFQLRAGIQWVPIKQVRVGFSVASPTFIVGLLEREAGTFGQSPPVGTVLPPDDPNAQASGGEQSRGTRGGWWGVEPGNMRFGVAYVGSWGWIEGDLVINWRLRTPDLGLDLKGIINGKIGSAFRLAKSVNLGLGLFTDRSQTDVIEVAPLATTDVNLYGFHLGFLFSNREVHPDRPDPEPSGKHRLGISLAVGFRYSYGRGQALGILVPAVYNPSAIVTQAVNGEVHEVAINLGANVTF